MGAIDAIRARNPFPEGTFSVGIGLAVTGITSLVYLTVSGRVLGPTEFGALSQLWFLVFLFGGVFVPFEQEIGRRLAALRVRGQGGRSVIRRTVALGGGVVALIVLLAAVLSPVLSERLFQDQTLLVVGLMLGAVGYLTANISQGILAGNGRFGRYGAFLGMDASLRLVIALVVLALGVRVAGPVGLALGIAPLVTALVLVVGRRDLAEPGPELPWRELLWGLGWLLGASFLAQLLINAAPILVGLYAGPDDAGAAGLFTAALVVARVPLFLFQAVQAALLPRLSRLAAEGELDAFRAGIVRLAVLVGGLVVVGCIAGFTIGPWVIETFFGGAYTVDRVTVGLLAAASGGFLTAMALSLGLIALSGAPDATAGWAVGVVTLFVVTALGDDPVRRVSIGFTAATVMATIAMGLLLARRLRRGAQLEPDAVADAVADITFDI